MSKHNKDHGRKSFDFTDSGFFLLRTALLPIQELDEWSRDLEPLAERYDRADHAGLKERWQRNVSTLRSRLSQLVERPDVRHALFIASPSLESAIEHWKKDPESKKGLQAERALVRYFARMVCRPTPFGLFSGCSLGSIDQAGVDNRTELNFKARKYYVPSTRLDFGYLFGLTRALRSNPDVFTNLRFWPNTSLYNLDGTWNYVESRAYGPDGERSYHLVRVEEDGFLGTAIVFAQRGATLEQIAGHIRACPDAAELSSEEILDYVKELIDSEILVPSLIPLVTGEQALDDIISQLRGMPSTYEAADILASVRQHLARIDEAGLGCGVDQFIEVGEQLSKLAEPDLGKLFQTDLLKPFESGRLARTVADEIMEGVQLLRRISRVGESEDLRIFRDAFSARYEQSWVPLVEALDPDAGIGFGRDSGLDVSPLLRGLNFGANAHHGGSPQLDLNSLLFQKLTQWNGAQGEELVIESSEIAPFDPRGSRLPDSFGVTVSIVAHSAEAIQKNEFRILLHGCDGPPGVRMLGRFCHADPDINRLVREHLREEEAFDKDSIYAEVAFLPEGSIGNVLCRPVLRDYEICYLARSGAPPDRQIPVSDLLISLQGGRIRLFSRTLNKYIVPRLSNAHGYINPRLPAVYRFLCHLQQEGGYVVPGFFWGQLSGLAYLPRVRVGRFVLSRARWKLNSLEIAALKATDRFSSFLALQELRTKRGMPRWIALQEMDYSLPVDLDNPLAADSFIHALSRASDATISEVYPQPSELCVSGPEGTFFHELLVPLLRKPESIDERVPNRSSNLDLERRASPSITREERAFPPGSQWLYAKFYAGEVFLNHFLATTVAELTKKALEDGIIDSWYFLRYADPHPHLRVRFHGKPDQLTGHLLERFSIVNDAISPGKLWRTQFDTYEREIERYGGPMGMLLSESVFFADSEFALTVLQECQDDEALDGLWRLTLVSLDRLLTDLHFDLPSKRDLFGHLRDSYEKEFSVGSSFRKQLGERFRLERGTLESMIKVRSGSVPARVVAALDRRSERLRTTAASLETANKNSMLTTDLASIASAFLHMSINRLIRSSQRAHELVLYDFLFRIYDAELSRSKPR